MDDHVSAQISLIGMLLDASGGLFLAYDLLGGEKGPLSTFTRVFTYSVLGTLFYSISMGLRFGLIVGLALGSSLGLHLDRLQRGKKDTFLFMVSVSLVRACGLSLAVSLENHPLFALIGFFVIFCTSMLLPKFIGPAMLIEASNKPTLNRKKIGFALLLGVIVTFADVLCVSVGGVPKEGVATMVKLSTTVVLATLMIAIISPSIEWYADNVEPKKLGYLGTVLFILGFLLQALPSLVTVLQ